MEKNYLKKAEPNKRARIREQEGTEAVQKAKKQLDQAIKDYKLSNKLNELKKNKTVKKEKDVVDDAYMKMIATKHKKINQEMGN